jgi:hypothetical protein
MNPEVKPLADAIYRDRVARARLTPPEERLLAGPQLFDYACSITLAALRQQMPNASETELLAALRQRIARTRELDEAT